MDRLLILLSVALIVLFIFGAGIRWSTAGRYRDSRGRLSTGAALERIGTVIVAVLLAIAAYSFSR